MEVTIKDCYELDSDYQIQFLGKHLFPEPKYNKLKLSEVTVNKIHYDDVYILEPQHYYYVDFNEEVKKFDEDDSRYMMNVEKSFYKNGLILSLVPSENKMFIFNASQNIIYLRKNTNLGEVFLYG